MDMYVIDLNVSHFDCLPSVANPNHMTKTFVFDCLFRQDSQRNHGAEVRSLQGLSNAGGNVGQLGSTADERPGSLNLINVSPKE